MLQLASGYETADLLRDVPGPDGAAISEAARRLIAGWLPTVGRSLFAEDGISGAQFLGDTHLFYTRGEKNIRCWDADRWDLAGSLLGHPRPVSVIGVAPDQATAATFCRTGMLDPTTQKWKTPSTIHLWDLGSRQERWHADIEEFASSITFVTARRLVVSCENFNRIVTSYVIDTADGHTLTRIVKGRPAFAQAGTHAAFWGAGVILLETHESRPSKPHPPSPPVSGLSRVAFTPDGERVVVAFSNGMDAGVCVERRPPRVGPRMPSCDSPSPVITSRPLPEVEPTEWLIVAPDNATMVGGDQQRLQLWDLASGEPRGPTLRSPGNQLYSMLKFSPDSATLTAAGSGFQQTWNTATGDPLHGAVDLSGQNVVAISADARWVVVKSKRLFSLIDAWYGRLRVVPLDGKMFGQLTLSTDARWMLAVRSASAPEAAFARIWDLDALQPRFEVMSTLTAMSPDGRFLFANDSGMSLGRGIGQLWDLETCRVAGDPLFYREVIRAFFVRGGKGLVTCTGNYEATEWRLWGLETTPPKSTLFHSGAHDWNSAVSADGGTIATSGSTSGLRSGTLLPESSRSSIGLSEGAESGRRRLECRRVNGPHIHQGCRRTAPA